MKTNEHEQKIKDLRILEAKKKDYMGLKGKFGVILKTMGQPIIRHQEGCGKFYSENYLEDYLQLEEENIPTSDTEDRDPISGWEWSNPASFSMHSTSNEGWLFDGLSRGMPLEIWYKEEESEIKVIYKGHIVYREEAGDLKSFVPEEEWQNITESLYKEAYKLVRIHQNKQNKNKTKKEESLKTRWLKKMKNLWGL